MIFMNESLNKKDGFEYHNLNMASTDFKGFKKNLCNLHSFGLS